MPGIPCAVYKVLCVTALLLLYKLLPDLRWNAEFRTCRLNISETPCCRLCFPSPRFCFLTPHQRMRPFQDRRPLGRLPRPVCAVETETVEAKWWLAVLWLCVDAYTDTLAVLCCAGVFRHDSMPASARAHGIVPTFALRQCVCMCARACTCALSPLTAQLPIVAALWHAVQTASG